MSKDPAILFYTSDFLTGTAFFNDEQRGQYIRLLCEQHQNGHIPKEHMINICKSYDNPVFRKFTTDSAGMYFNVRMENEILRRVSYSESRRENRKGGKKEDIKSEDMLNHMSGHMETETITETIIVSRPNYHLIFDKVLKDNNIDLPKEFYDLILEWLKYKSEKGQTYKETGLKSFIVKAMTDCGGSAGTLKNMILYSTSNNYSGLFKEQSNGTKNSKGNSGATNEELAGYFAKRYGTDSPQ